MEQLSKKYMERHNKETSNPVEEIDKESRKLSILFFLLGSITLSGWINIFCTAEMVCQHFKQPNFVPMIFLIAAFAESLTRLLVGIFWTKVKHIKRALAFSIILSIAYIIIGGGMQTEEFYGFVFSMVACFLTGCSSGLGCVTSYGYLKVFPEGMVAAYAAGQGFSGIYALISFAIYITTDVSLAFLFICQIPVALAFVFIFQLIDSYKETTQERLSILLTREPRYGAIALGETNTEDVNNIKHRMINIERKQSENNPPSENIEDVADPPAQKVKLEKSIADTELGRMVVWDDPDENLLLKCENFYPVLRKIWWLSVNITLVFVAEYIILSALSERAALQILEQEGEEGRSGKFHKTTHAMFLICYGVGNFLARGSLKFFKITFYEILTILQISNLVFWCFEAQYMLIRNKYMLCPLMFVTGMIGGASFINIMYLTLRNEKLLFKETEMAVVQITLFYDLGTLIAAIVSLFIVQLWMEQQLLENYLQYNSVRYLRNIFLPPKITRNIKIVIHSVPHLALSTAKKQQFNKNQIQNIKYIYIYIRIAQILEIIEESQTFFRQATEEDRMKKSGVGFVMPDKIPGEMRSKLNLVRNRILFLPPSVVSGEERECCKEDFQSLENTNIGVGGFGRVFKVQHKASKNIYAIKVINKKRILEEKMEAHVMLETKIMYKINHEHIIKLYNHYEDEDNFYLIMQFAQGQLYTKLKKLGKLDERAAAQYMREVISAVEYLHSRNPPIIHRDIKPENILLDGKDSVKLADFGWSNFFDSEAEEKRMTYCGTPVYLAPEMIKKLGHNETIDLWNLGILLYELLTGSPPFQGKTKQELFEKIQNVKMSFPRGFSNLARDLINRLLKSNPQARIPLSKMKTHPWFKANPAFRAVLTKKIFLAKTMEGLEGISPRSPRSPNGKSPRSPRSPRLDPGEYDVISRRSVGKQETSSVPASVIDNLMEKNLKNLEARISVTHADEKDKQIAALNKKLELSNISLQETHVKYQLKMKDMERNKQENIRLTDKLLEIDRHGWREGGERKVAEVSHRLALSTKEKKELLDSIDRLNLNQSEIQTRLKHTEHELEIASNARESIQAKYSILQEKYKLLEKKYFDHKAAYDRNMKDADARSNAFKDQIDVLEMKLMNQTVEREEIPGKALEDITSFINKSLLDLRPKIGELVLAEKSYDHYREELMESEKKLSELKSKYENDLYDVSMEQSKILEEQLRKFERNKGEDLKEKDVQITSLQKRVFELEKEATNREIRTQTMEQLEKQQGRKDLLIENLRLEVKLLSNEVAAQNTEILDLKADIDFGNIEVDGLMDIGLDEEKEEIKIQSLSTTTLSSN